MPGGPTPDPSQSSPTFPPTSVPDFNTPPQPASIPPWSPQAAEPPLTASQPDPSLSTPPMPSSTPDPASLAWNSPTPTVSQPVDIVSQGLDLPQSEPSPAPVAPSQPDPIQSTPDLSPPTSMPSTNGMPDNSMPTSIPTAAPTSPDLNPNPSPPDFGFNNPGPTDPSAPQSTFTTPPPTPDLNSQPTQTMDTFGTSPASGSMPVDPTFPPLGNSTAQPPTDTQPTWMPPSTSPQPDLNTPPPVPDPTLPQTPPSVESAPTDLSHLLGSTPAMDAGTTEPSSASTVAPETVVVPSEATNPAPDVPTMTNQEHKPIPKWLIGVGVGLLILVVGASAYFILGVGQTPAETSVPAEVSKPTVQNAPPVATPVPQATPPESASDPSATASANFGQLQGSGTQQQQATSAADLLRQRQTGAQ